MKKLFLTLIVAFFTITGGIAQNVTVEEPEFAEETLLLTSNNQGVKLSRENGTVKTKAGASLYLTGIGKVKSRLTSARFCILQYAKNALIRGQRYDIFLNIP